MLLYDLLLLFCICSFKLSILIRNDCFFLYNFILRLFFNVTAKKIYDSAMVVLNKTRPNKPAAYELLLEASEKGSLDAKAMIAWAELFGNPLKQNLESAKQTFVFLADRGHPDGHMVG